VPFDVSAFETKQIFFTSKDGTRIPMFVTARKGLSLDGAHPTIMTAYGFGGIPSLPRFYPQMIAWMERGGIFAVVNIRGGGEYGEDWHRAAMRTHRQVGFDDFIAAGEWLVANGYTSRQRLGILGRSGGGMLVGGVLVQRPELFGAAVSIAGVLDLLRFQLFGQGAGWQGDMGSPDDPAEFPALHALSPLHNVRAGTRYPPTLVVTADHDVRVAPLHSYKFAAALQHAQGGPGPILLNVETQSGHGGGSTLDQKIDQQTDILAFLGESLGLSLTEGVEQRVLH
jgi:prolyl oligopeptidase